MIAITPVMADQLALLCDIERACFPQPWSEEQLAADFERAYSRYLALWEDGKMIGYASMWIMFEEAHVVSVAVVPSARRRGLGARLMRELIAVARQDKCLYTELECRASNVIAQGMYHKLGFMRVGCKKGYYDDTGEDAYVYALYPLPENINR